MPLGNLLAPVIDLLAAQPLLLLFVVCAIGYPLGRIRVGGAPLGNASVLFTGLAVGAIDPRLKVPDFVYLFGLAVFVYMLGLSAARGFFDSLTKKGLRDNLLVLGTLGLAGVAAFAWSRWQGLRPAEASGMFSGAFTNASGLASIIDTLKGLKDPNLTVPVVAYSLAYPVGIIGPLITMAFARKIFRVDLRAEAETLPIYQKLNRQLVTKTLLVTREDATRLPLVSLLSELNIDVVVGRLVRGSHTEIATGDSQFELQDAVVVVGNKRDVETLADRLGQISEHEVQHDRAAFDIRRIFVSNPAIVGRRLSELDLPRKYGATVTRLRRGDSEILPTGDTILEPGDRVRVLTQRENMPAVTKLFGDSYKMLSDADLVAFCIGMAVGLAVGLIPIPLPGGVSFRLGFAGGPLVVALILGRIGRSGPIVWALPYSANLTLRQLGLTLFAAGIGTRAGYDFVVTLSHGLGIMTFLGGLLLTAGAGIVLLTFGHRVLKLPLNHLYGIYAGAQTQPVSLIYAQAQTGNEIPQIGYARVFPLAIVLKIVIGQLLFAALR